MNATLASLAREGYAMVPDALGQAELDRLDSAIDTLAPAGDDGIQGGMRDLFTLLPASRELAAHPAIWCWPSAVLGPKCFAVRAILFDKRPEANWKVAWHQDLTIAVRKRLDVPGFGPWSRKAGIPHVQPPTEILERMLAVRVHLDPCGYDNGRLRVLPGSHLHGKLTPSAIDDWKAGTAAVELPCPAGGLLVMRPLLVHASSAAERPGRRRVIHFEFAADHLPNCLEWREQWGQAASAA
ncbi:MAG TPA: phytanoyl-CoA dioxygenase family protein [Pirellulales bacterium]|jgi:ectoine hydroxylase-related dioxygenase (phytanoyl-CoA dioxygenase family)|nr:phytanoyl-CoA dioxygenase family protein [Pirellulales bacterium]